MTADHDTTGDPVDGEPPPTHSGVGRPVIVGEVLFDAFPDGARVLGGAPFNVAWHLQAFGLAPLVVTRIGDDALGGEILDAMDDWGMDRAGIQVDPNAPTGRVEVAFGEDGPAYEILPDQAYDRIDAAAAAAAVAPEPAGVLYHGSLIARSARGRAVLDTLAEAAEAPIFVDVNLRDPWWRRSTVLALLDRADRAKLNDDELERLVDPPEDPSLAGDLEVTAARFAEQCGLGQVVVTCGDRGAVVLSGGRLAAGRPPLSVDVVDTVGAGDAFSAVWITGAVRGWSLDETVVRALDFAAAVCGLRGATTDDRALYDEYLEAWEERS